jgi:S1-C subfamily serine protease
MCRPTGLVLACVFVTPPLLGAEDGIPARKLQELKAATVYVKVEGKEGTATGSGFLIRVEGETGFVVTNQHVVGAVPGLFTPEKFSLVFWGGTKKELARPAEVVAEDAERDLAVLKVTARGLPAPLDLSQKVKLRETMTVYTFGFPLGDLLAPARRNPAVTIGKGTVSSLREDERGKITEVQLDAELNPGNSGGPVVDPEGKLVRVAVAKIGGTKISFAIPPAELIDTSRAACRPSPSAACAWRRARPRWRSRSRASTRWAKSSRSRSGTSGRARSRKCPARTGRATGPSWRARNGSS